MKYIKLILFSILIFNIILPIALFAQNENEIPHLEKVNDTITLIVDNRPFIMLAGEVHNSSSSSLEYMNTNVWPELVALNCNTAIITVSWEMFEPQEGMYDYRFIDGLIRGARENSLKLVVIWFASWKNAWSTYTPAWIKRDVTRFPRAQLKSGELMGTLSPLGIESCNADARAFAALMKHIREIDEKRTVIMMQVENETGILKTDRDYSPLANVAFEQNVPEHLMNYLEKNRSTLHSEMISLWQKTGFQKSGSWSQVFGDFAGEVFMAWYIASYLEKVAAAGKAEYPLPMFANAWLVQFPGQEAGKYPSGGPVSRMFDVWRCAAPSLDVFAPDIYIENFTGVCDDYKQKNNPLIIPEARRDAVSIGNLFYAIGEKHALCFSPFGIETMVSKKELEGDVPWFGQMGPKEGVTFAQCYKLFGQMMPIITHYQGSEKMIGFVQEEKETIVRELGRYVIHITFTGSRAAGKIPGSGLIISETPDDFILIGQQFSFRFYPGKGSKKHVDYLEHTEGFYKDGLWISGRRLNGDEYYLPIGEKPEIRKVSLYSYE